MTYKLFLDDIREPHLVNWGNIHQDRDPWVVVRSYDEFVACVEARGVPHFVAFDHDLQDAHYHTDDVAVLEKTGNHCAEWLVEYCRDRNILRPKFAVHSMNPVGAQRIRDTMRGL